MNPMRHRNKPIRTNLMEILQALSSYTSDDNLVLAAVKDLLQSNRLRLTNSMATLRLAEATGPVRRVHGPRRRLH